MKKNIVTISFLFFLCITLGLYSKNLTNNSKKIEKINFNKTNNIIKRIIEKVEEVSGVLYILNDKKEKLISKDITFSKEMSVEEKIGVIFEELNLELLKSKIILKPLSISNIFIKDKKIFLNILPIDFAKSDKSETEQLLVLYSITNSIVSNTEKERVKFLINGEEKKGIYENFYEKNINVL